MQKQPGREYYFNINYLCNSHCVFCASDNQQFSVHGTLSCEEMKNILAKDGVGPESNVTINGGEPTMSEDLANMLSLVKSRGASSCLFTNGRKLSDLHYAKRILQAMRGIVMVPLFGEDAGTHDALTGVRGSFDETVRGLKNVFFLRDKYRLNVSLELRLLFVKPTIKKTHRIARMMISEFPNTDLMSINSLILSSKAMGKREKLVASLDHLNESIKMTLDVLKNFRGRVLLGTIPFCLLHKKHYGYAIRKTGNTGNGRKVIQKYFDPRPDLKKGVLLTPDTCSEPDKHDESRTQGPGSDQDGVDRICRNCKVSNQCRFRISGWMLKGEKERARALRRRNRFISYHNKT